MKGEIKSSASKRLAQTPLGVVEKPGPTPDLQSPLEIPGKFFCQVCLEDLWNK